MHEFSAISKDESTRDLITRLRAETFRSHKYNISRYLSYLAEETHTKIVISGDLVIEFLKSQKILKGAKSGQDILLGTMKSMVVGIIFLRKLWANYTHRNETNDQLKSELIEGDLSFHNLNKVETYIKTSNLSEHVAKKNDLYFDEDLVDQQILYHTTELKTMIIKSYDKVTEAKPAVSTKPLNSIMEMLLGEHLLLRGMEKRALCLRDLFFQKATSKLPNILKFRLSVEKAMYTHVGCARNKYSEICLVGAIAMNLWFRLDFPGGPLHGPLRPNFLDPKDYFGIKIQYFRDSAQTRAVSKTYEGELVADALELIGKRSKAKTLLGRRNGARLADRSNVSEEQIRRQGRWGHDSLVVNNLEGIPMEFLKSKAGFEQDETFSIARERIIPPKSLQKKIFPWLEERKEAFEKHDTNRAEGVQCDTYAPFFFEMLDQFRSIILQDLVFLGQQAPNSIFAKHSINKDPEFLEFKSQFDHFSLSTLFIESLQPTEDTVDSIKGRVVDLNSRTHKSLVISHNSIDRNVLQLNTRMERMAANSEKMKADIEKMEANNEKMKAENES